MGKTETCVANLKGTKYLRLKLSMDNLGLLKRYCCRPFGLPGNEEEQINIVLFVEIKLKESKISLGNFVSREESTDEKQESVSRRFLRDVIRTYLFQIRWIWYICTNSSRSISWIQKIFCSMRH